MNGYNTLSLFLTSCHDNNDTGEVIMNGCQWAEWAPFSVCSKTCGGGRKVIIVYYDDDASSMVMMVMIMTMILMMLMMVTMTSQSNCWVHAGKGRSAVGPHTPGY